MFKPSNSQHASLSGIVLPETPPSPAVQGNHVRQAASDCFAYAKECHAIMLRELAEEALPALYLRPLLIYLGIRVIESEEIGQGVALACSERKQITMGAPDRIASLGPFHKEVRAYTSALAWGFARIRLEHVSEGEQARLYAAALLCPQDRLLIAPELPAISRSGNLETLAKRFMVAPWVIAEAVRGYALQDRVLVGV